MNKEILVGTAKETGCCHLSKTQPHLLCVLRGKGLHMSDIMILSICQHLMHVKCVIIAAFNSVTMAGSNGMAH